MANKYRLIILTGIYIIVFAIFCTYYTVNLLNKLAITSFKKLYTAYNQALLITVEEMDGETGCYFSTSEKYDNRYFGCDKFYKKFATNLNVTEYCKNKSLAKGCITEYKNYSNNKNCSGFSKNMMENFNQTFVMRDKSSITIFNQPQGIQKPIFAVDSNGKLFPNKSGHDLFSMVIMRNNKGLYYFHTNITYCLPFERNGIHMLQDIFK